jgi:hypothetical protein
MDTYRQERKASEAAWTAACISAGVEHVQQQFVTQDYELGQRNPLSWE